MKPGFYISNWRSRVHAAGEIVEYVGEGTAYNDWHEFKTEGGSLLYGTSREFTHVDDNVWMASSHRRLQKFVRRLWIDPLYWIKDTAQTFLRWP